MLKDYKKLQDICIEEIKTVGINPATNITWKVNSRAKKRWGQCTKKPSGECIIEIADWLLTDDRVPEKECKDTIIHELLHSCKECKGHTGKWKEYAQIMNMTYGYHISRTSSRTALGLEAVKTNRLPVKYVFVCKYCGQRIYKKKACKFTKYYRNYGCGICGHRRAFVRC